MERTNLHKAEFAMKIEIWVSFSDKESEKISKFTNDFASFCGEVGWSIMGGFTFKNNAVVNYV